MSQESEMVATRFLMGTGGSTAKFLEKGDSVEGVIVDMEERQQTDFTSNEPLFWDTGEPRMQLVITLLTEEKEDKDDDSLRKLYVKANMKRAVQQAIIASGSRTIKEGGVLSVTYTGIDKPKRKGLNGAKLYAASYEPGILLTGDDDEN